jgi:hypothetical protein
MEMEPRQLDCLRTNADLNGWNDGTRRIRIVARAFELDDLKSRDFDFVKMDIEGGEAALLRLDKIDFPLALEVHGTELRDRLVAKFGFRIRKRSMPFEDAWLATNAAANAS